MQVIKPNSLEQSYDFNTTTIFLAGSIEMGSAEDWQSKVEKELADKNVIIFNPRRDDWDSSWFQEEKNEQFNQQVNWEMNRMIQANVIFMYLDPNTKSPISLLELGLHADNFKLIVCCPSGFWRKGNVDIVCTRYGIPRFEKLEDAIGALKTKINQEQ
jgi:hypothetical protein